jgi:SAM-dependent methyltransferase
VRADQYALDAELADRHWWWVARRRLLTYWLDRLLGPAGPERRVLEVGCSTGSNLRLLQRYGAVEGLEMHDAAVALCHARYPDIPVRQGAIPMALDRRYDALCLFDVLEHIDDDEGALDWCHEHLTESGRLFLTVPAFQFLWSRHDEVAHHQRRYTKATLLPRVARRFAVDYVSYFNFHLFPAIAAARLLQRGLGLPGGEADKRVGAGALNGLLTALFASERFWLGLAPLPFGVSLFVAARRRPAA